MLQSDSLTVSLSDEVAHKYFHLTYILFTSCNRTILSIMVLSPTAVTKPSDSFTVSLSTDSIQWIIFASCMQGVPLYELLQIEVQFTSWYRMSRNYSVNFDSLFKLQLNNPEQSVPGRAEWNVVSERFILKMLVIPNGIWMSWGSVTL